MVPLQIKNGDYSAKKKKRLFFTGRKYSYDWHMNASHSLHHLEGSKGKGIEVRRRGGKKKRVGEQRLRNALSTHKRGNNLVTKISQTVL